MPTTAKLLSYYRLNEDPATYGGVILDTGPATPHNGTVVGAPLIGQPTLVTDDTSHSIKTGNSNYINLGQPADFIALTDEWSLEAWVKIDTNPAGAGVISREYFAGSTYVQWELGFDIDGTGLDNKLTVGWYDPTNGWKIIRDSVAPPSGVPIYICGTWDGTDMKLYKGIPGAALTTVGTLTPGTAPPTPSLGDFYIGRRHDAGPTQWGFPGWISEVAIYNEALTQAEAEDNYERGFWLPAQAASATAGMYDPRLVPKAWF